MKRARADLYVRWPPPEQRLAAGAQQAPAAGGAREWGRPLAGLLCLALAAALTYVNLRRTPIRIAILQPDVSSRKEGS